MKYALFLGCTAPVRAQNYELSSRKVAERLGIQLVDLDFTCCGFPVENIKHETALAMAARNLALAEKNGLDVVAICSACATTLTRLNMLLKESEELLRTVNEHLKALGYEYKGSVKAKHFARLLYEDIGLDRIRAAVKKPLKGVKIAVHYGCHYTRPSEVQGRFEDYEAPHSLQDLVEVTGAETVPHESEKCCGGALLGIDQEVAFIMSKEKLDYAKSAGADALVIICPFCGLMYDVFQENIGEMFNKEYRLPVLYYPQLLGLAMGFSADELGFRLNRVEATSLIEKIAKGGI